MVPSCRRLLLNKRDMVRPKHVPPRGILYRDAGTPPVHGYARFWPGEDLAPFVEHYWTLSWDTDDEEVHEVLPHPSVHLALERGASRVVGVQTGRYTARLKKRGRILGVKFRPGGFRPFVAHPVAELTDRTLTPGEVLDGDFGALEAKALAITDAAAAFTVVQSFLCALRPRPDATVALVDSIARRAAEDRAITRVEHLADAFDIGRRSLQRLFHDYVGVSPKWIIQRYRLHEAVERIATDGTIDWAALALDLGYADQAHFVRDFRRLVGEPPARYAQRAANVTSAA